MKLNKIFRYFLYAILLVIALGFSIVFFWDKLPYQSAAERKIEQFLEEKNIKVNALEIEKVSSTVAQISVFDIGKEKQLVLRNITANYQLSKPFSQQDLSGKITSDNVQIIAEEFEIPQLKMLVDFKLAKENFSADINLHSKDNTWKLLANLDIPTANPSEGIAKIKQLKFPYLGGEISTKNVKLPLSFAKAISADITLKNVDLNQLMAKISDGKISGTGNINGTIPLKYYPDGRIEFGDGELKSAEAGVIAVAPELLAGDNEQMQITRTALENFHYTILKIGVSSDNGKLTLNLNLQGNNPQAFSGQKIKLNINLNGDVLPLIQQSILPINDIKQLLKEAK